MSKARLPQSVLMSTDPVGGVWNYSLELAREFSKMGIQVILASIGGPLGREQIQTATAIPHLQLFASCAKLEWMQNAWADVERSGEWLLELESRFEPDLIHLNGYAHAALPWRAPTIVVAHSCVLSWWQAVKTGNPPSEWDTYRERVQEGLQAADAIVAPSSAMLASIEANYGWGKCTHVIPNGIRPAHGGSGARSQLVLSVGRLWDEAKNMHSLARIAKEICWPVFMAGDARHPNGSAATYDNVLLLGQLAPHELLPWYRAASIYALPAKYEPFGLTILEAAQAGCALVAGDIPSLRENWNGAAVFVHPEDSKGLTSALRTLIARPELLRSYAEHAQKRALEFSSRAMAAAYLDLYLNLLQEDCQPEHKEEGVLCAS